MEKLKALSFSIFMWRLNVSQAVPFKASGKISWEIHLKKFIILREGAYWFLTSKESLLKLRRQSRALCHQTQSVFEYWLPLSFILGSSVPLCVLCMQFIGIGEAFLSVKLKFPKPHKMCTFESLVSRTQSFLSFITFPIYRILTWLIYTA